MVSRGVEERLKEHTPRKGERGRQTMRDRGWRREGQKGCCMMSRSKLFGTYFAHSTINIDEVDKTDHILNKGHELSDQTDPLF